ncbi:MULTISPECIES: DUF805 domain-containing protein [Corynebacterium]|uniref:DUF805 domain-containing protein n=1 Tax=Corynebacterium TaxID=1716 RepID=UPI00264C50F2|nr:MULTISPECIES: DUF805 domain-containing protein [Corynebacterium]MDN8625307.1 DUF805 domain-containing protein [Corynebacterium kroppenstedtii]
MTDMQPFPSQNDTEHYGAGTPGGYHGPDDAPEYDGEPPLSQPFYGASLPAAVKRFVTRVFRFKGRSSRSEYWWVQLVLFLIYAAVSVVALSVGVDPDDVNNPVGIATAIFNLIILVPSLSLTWRRLHDAGFCRTVVLHYLHGYWCYSVFHHDGFPVEAREDERKVGRQRKSLTCRLIIT